MKKKLNVLISNVSYQAATGSFLKMLRHSQYYDCYIVGCDFLLKGFSSGSMLVDKFYQASNQFSESEYASFILEICKNENIDIVLSAEEKDLIMFKKMQLEQSLHTYIAEESIFNLFKDKHLANLDVQEKSILTPKTIMGRTDFDNSIKNKFIMRKRVSCCSRGIKIFDRRDIPSNYDSFTNDYITQEFISGSVYTVDVFCDKLGNARIMIPRKGLAGKDGTTFKCIIEREGHILDVCKKFYSQYKVPGISNIQFIVKDDRPYFIELNPRAAATIIASSLASVNFLDLYISHFLYDEEISDYDTMMNNVKWNSVVSRYYQETIMYR